MKLSLLLQSFYFPEKRPYDVKKYSDNKKLDTEAAESGGHDKCCPHVVDPWLFLGILAGLAVTTFVLRMQITMFIMGKKRRRRKRSNNEIEISITNPSSKLTNLKQDWGKKVILKGELELL